MDTNLDDPISLPVDPDRRLLHSRVVFSRDSRRLASHHVSGSDAADSAPFVPRRRVNDYSLRLIDDLTNRPVDPLFLDARLMPHHRSAVRTWATRAVVFVICIAVGFVGSAFVRLLNTDPRKQIRISLANELEQQTTSLDALNSEVSSLRGKVDAQSKKLGTSEDDSVLTQDEMMNGAVAVKGEGVVLTIADPLAASSDSSSSSSQLRVVTDADLQTLVSILWQAGAEAIAINGYRLGVQTSIRTAGQTILIGASGVDSSYSIKAIGNPTTLAKAVGSDEQAQLYATFAEAGIYPHVSRSSSITLEAAASGDVSYARKEG